MKDGTVIVASFVHGNALGVVLEPKSAAKLPKSQRNALWKVCIGPLVAEVAATTEFPADDFAEVVFDMRQFLIGQGLPNIPVREPIDGSSVDENRPKAKGSK